MTTILSKRIKASVNLFLAVAFIVHISYIFYYIVYPTLPEIKNYKKQLNEIEFPIHCKSDPLFKVPYVKFAAGECHV